MQKFSSYWSDHIKIYNKIANISNNLDENWWKHTYVLADYHRLTLKETAPRLCHKKHTGQKKYENTISSMHIGSFDLSFITNISLKIRPRGNCDLGVNSVCLEMTCFETVQLDHSPFHLSKLQNLYQKYSSQKSIIQCVSFWRGYLDKDFTVIMLGVILRRGQRRGDTLLSTLT